MGKSEHDKNIKFNFGTTFTGMVIGFLGAAVLYQKSLPDWVPFFLTDNPIAFFSLFIVICGILGYIWALTD